MTPACVDGRAFALCLGVAFVAFGKRSLGGGELDLEALHLRGFGLEREAGIFCELESVGIGSRRGRRG
jgi:hypothetical protein